MKNARVSRFVIVAFGLFLILPGGCTRTRASKFYTLDSLPESQTGEQAALGENEMVIGVGPFKIPDYLDRPQIITRVSPNKVELAEFNRWAEPLRDSIPNVLAENLSILLATDRVVVFPWKSSVPIDYQVKVVITRFDGTPGKVVSMKGRWALFGEGGEKMIVVKRTKIQKRVDGKGYEAVVSAQGRALAELSRQIADAISAASREGIGQ